MLKLLSDIFSYFVDRRNNKFDSAKIPVHKCNVPVISIGNISAGGTGKTPFTQSISKELLKHNVKPAIIGRGYRGKIKDGLIVRDEKQILADSTASGDEMYMLAKNLNVPIITHSKKAEAAKIAFEKFHPDCIIVDDGFQHRFLARDLDIVLIDKDTVDNPFLIPKGRLRETFKSLDRAEVVAINKNVDSLETIQNYLKNKIVIRYENKPDAFYRYFENKKIEIDTNEKYIAFSGIAKNGNFLKSLNEFGIIPVEHLCYKDHHNYTEKDIDKMVKTSRMRGAKYIITTEKDAVKMDKFAAKFKNNNLELIYLKLYSFVYENSDLLISKLLNTIRKSNE